MQAFLIYVLLSAGCVSVVWLLYKALLENRMPVKTIRFYFLIGITVAILAPVSPFVIRPSVAVETPDDPVVEQQIIAHATGIKATDSITQTTAAIDWKKSIPWIFYTYLTIVGFLLIGTGRELIVMLRCYKKATKEKRGGLQLVWNDRFKDSFSFFRLVFMNKEQPAEGQNNILLHEQMSVITNDHVQGSTATSANDHFSPEQIKLIQSITKDQRIIIDEVVASGPDGRAMKMPSSMVFTIL
jgi:hypothetical protein